MTNAPDSIASSADIACVSGHFDPSPSVTVVYEDAHLLMLDKPGGLLAVPGRGPDRADCLSARAQQRWPDALIVHRLDQATSGLIVLARGIDVQRRLSAAFAERRVHKRYEALVHGQMVLPAVPDGDATQATSPDIADDDDRASDWALIDLPLIVDWPRRPRSKVDPLLGKPSRTRWRPLAYNAANDTTRVALEPITGRSHQLRVHLLAQGHPIVGDALYDAPDQAPRLMLHACTLALRHPVTDAPLRFASAVPF